MKADQKTFLHRMIDALGLAVVVVILFAGVRLAPGVVGEAGKDAKLVTAVGFLLLAGTLTSGLVEIIGVPHLTGYIIVGVVAGPYVLHLIDHETAHRLEGVDAFAIALIALAGGAELKLDSLKKGLKTLTVSSLIQPVLVMTVSTAAFYFVEPSFVRGMPKAAIFGVALVWGIAATTRSPSALLAILSQTRAQGKLARYSLAFILTSDAVVVVSLACVVTVSRPLIEPNASMSLDAFRTLGHELLGSVAMGTTLGLALAAYVKIVGRQLLVVLVALGYGATEALHYVSFEPILTFLVAGFVVTNLSNQGDKFLHAVESTGEVVYVLFFAAAGASLNVPLLQALWPAALLFVALRGGTTWVANKVSMRITKDDPVLEKWGWSALVSQAGVAIGIANAAARSFPTFGAAFRDLAIACVGINELVGPVLFKLALDRTGETKAPVPSLTDAEELKV